MNIRSLAPVGPGGNIASNAKGGTNARKEKSQASMGRARASWGNSLNFQLSVEEVSDGGSPLDPKKTSGRHSPVNSPGGQGTPEQLNGDPQVLEQEAMIARGDLEKLPTWLLQLHSIFSSMNGPEWKVKEGWPADRFIPRGLAVDSLNIEIYGVGRKFTSPSEILSIDLSWNGLNGDIGKMDGVWSIETLEVLSLACNRISGILPGPGLRQLTNLKELNLYRNGLCGHVPKQIRALSQLTCLWIFENHFSGPLPEIFDGLTSLTDLRCNSNRFTGPIPQSLAACTGLRTLYLQKNEFEGPVPEKLYLQCIRLKDLRLWANKLTGALNPEVGSLRLLECLMLQQNNFSWMLPVTLGKCTKLVTLDLSKNSFRGEVPAEAFETLKNLKTLNLSNNVSLHGKIPNGVNELPSLTYIDVACTGLEDKDEFAAAMTAKSDRVRVNTEGFIIDN